MGKFQDVLSAITEFLKETQNLGLIKEFSLNYVDNMQESPGSGQLISNLLTTLNKVQTTPDLSADMHVVDVDKNEDSAASNELMTSQQKNKLVQIQVDESEIKRRISAFISRKRKEVDEWNVQEFCSRPYIEEQNPMWEETDSCARVDTVFVPRSGSRSHVKVSRVENRWGPQTHLHVEAKQIKKEIGEETGEQFNAASLQAVEERLQNMEYHLRLKTENSRTNIFQRLKDLEDRILFLEGISPDYFHLPLSTSLQGTDFQSPKKKVHHTNKDQFYSSWTVEDVQKRIQNLKESLKTMAHQVKQEPAP